MDLVGLQAFECIPYNLLVAKSHVYGLSKETVTFIYSYLKVGISPFKEFILSASMGGVLKR